MVAGVVVPLFRGAQRARSENPITTLCMPGLWKKPDVARRFAVSERTVERWQLREALPIEKPFGLKGPVRYDPGRVEAWWLARCTNGAAS